MEFSTYLSHLKEPSTRLSVAALQLLDGLTREQAQAFRDAWPQIDTERRRQVTRQLVELAEDNVELNFDAVFFTLLEDDDAAVRSDAIRGLWEYEGRELIAPLSHLLEKDEEPEVRAEAALALGRFVLQSELGHLRESYARRVDEALRRTLEDDLEVDEVRARALEAIGASSHPWVALLIQQSYESDSRPLRVSSLHAMGRSCQPRWVPQLIDELTNEDPEMRYEAAVALGSLADRRSVPHLAPLLQDIDLEVKEAVIAALGQIGGREAKSLLRPLLRDPSPSVREAATAATAEADFLEDPLSVEYRL